MFYPFHRGHLSSNPTYLSTFQVSDKPVEELGRTDSDEADLLSFAELSCPLPSVPVDIDYRKTPGTPVGGFFVRLSNDGVNYSQNKSLFLVYDSKCMECTKTGERTCKWKVSVTILYQV